MMIHYLPGASSKDTCNDDGLIFIGLEDFLNKNLDADRNLVLTVLLTAQKRQI